MPGWEPFARDVRARRGELIVNISPLVEVLSLEHGDELVWMSRYPHSTRLELYRVDDAPRWTVQRQIRRQNSEFVLNIPSRIASVHDIEADDQLEFTPTEDCLARVHY